MNNNRLIHSDYEELFKNTPEEQLEHNEVMFSLKCMSFIEKMCDKKKMTKKELAKQLETSLGYILQLYRGDKIVKVNTLIKMSNILGFTWNIAIEENK